YYGYDKPSPTFVRDFNHLKQAIDEKLQDSKKVFVLSPTQLSLPKKKCTFLRNFSPSVLEKIVILANPAPNKRRKATWLYVCKSSALLGNMPRSAELDLKNTRKGLLVLKQSSSLTFFIKKVRDCGTALSKPLRALCQKVD
ncbi:MAG: hypothetical protein D6767_09350, partial [Candidatus Hydrogenedentota bacterium]